jgi:hypothetical protein
MSLDHAAINTDINGYDAALLTDMDATPADEVPPQP